MKRPSIGVWMICKDEERDLPRALRSIESIADQVVIVDTGSTDRTEIVARTSIDKPVTFVRYLGASERDAAGEWKLLDFSKARNFAIETAEQLGTSHLFWLDADDEVLTPLAVRRAAYLPPAVYSMHVQLQEGPHRTLHARLWPSDWRLRFHGACHEWVDLGARPLLVLDDTCIRHDAAPHGSETSNARNLRILEAEYARQPSARTAFYLGNTHKDAARWQDAARWFGVRIGYGLGFRDEYLVALLYLARCQRRAGDDAAAVATLRRGLAEEPTWMEFRMELAFIEYMRARYDDAIAEALVAVDAPIPPTLLWRERPMYQDQPARLISWCYEHMDQLGEAVRWSRKATERIGGPDAAWAQRERLLEARLAAESAAAPAIVTGQRRRIALYRPGAIGDILMTLNLLPAFKHANPDTDVHYFCDRRIGAWDALWPTMMAAGVDLVMDCTNMNAWRSRYDRVINLVGYPMAEGYPHRPMAKHLLQYFAAELGVALPGVLYYLALPRPARPKLDLPLRYATLQVKAGWSPYKNWPVERWTQVVERFPKITFVQIGAAGEPRVPGTIDGTGRTLNDAVALVANARLHVGVDSFANHLTAYLWTDHGGGRSVPGVILWGSTQASAAGYPGNTNITRALPCQPCFRESPEISRERTDPCPHLIGAVHACMADIGVDEVVGAISKAWPAPEERAA